VIVASDGVWEFIETQECAEMVAGVADATLACEQLVQEAADRWRRFEGTYRDDITAILAHLPFMGEPTQKGGGAAAEAPPSSRFINQGEVGISRMNSEDMSPEMKRAPPAWTKPAEEEEGTEGSPQGIRRRLSVMNPLGDAGDDDWEKGEEDAGASTA